MTHASTDPAAALPPVALCGRSALASLLGDLCGKRVTVMGLGLFGGGEGAVRFLAERGADVTVTDLRDAATLAPPLERLRDLPLRYRLGQHTDTDFTEADLVVANQVVPHTNVHLHAAAAANVPITSAMNMFLVLCPATIVAVTGSNGKSTTTSLLDAIMRTTEQRVFLGGNIGLSLLPQVAEMTPDDLVMLELSSFQLEYAAVLEWSPHVAVLTNLTPNHLDRHKDYEAYTEAKFNIFKFQTADDFAILNRCSPDSMAWLRRGLPARTLCFDSEPHPGGLASGLTLMAERLVWHTESCHELMGMRSDIPLPGRHNVENAMAAATAARCLGVDTPQIRHALSQFTALEHRLEPIGQFAGMRFYNDSFSTTPVSTIAALAAFTGPVTLIAGGYDKKLDIAPLAKAAAVDADVLVVIGQTGKRLAAQARTEAALTGRSLPIHEACSLEEAVDAAIAHSMPGSEIVLSPGFASFDMFDNCRQRGDVFKSIVRTRILQSRAASA
jgi:UDP-N-acetylmuramoylalanine--D-glutamate ligase